MPEKSLTTTYFLWAVGGIFGLHHFYLERDFQALIWWMFPGGYFGLGMIRDLWRIPDYVNDANENTSFIKKLTVQMRKNEKPPSSTFRSIGQLVLADSLGTLLISAIPVELIEDKFSITICEAIAAPLGVAVGTYLVGNIGRQEGSLISCLLGAYAVVPIYFIIPNPVSLSAIVSSYTFQKQWRRTTKKRHPVSTRILLFAVCAVIYLSLWCSWFYFNCVLNTKEQENVKCREAIKHFLKSPLWQEFLNVLFKVWHCFLDHGWREVWNQVIQAFDPVGEIHALKVLNLESAATQKEISARYRKLSREWHPDKNPDRKKFAEEKFIEIQQAYKTLLAIKSRRQVSNDGD